MAKRSSFPRISKDKYNTPIEAVLPLLPQLPAGTLFAEPCAGAGVLIDHLQAYGHRCVLAVDPDPEHASIWKEDALNLQAIAADMVITNPPWTRSIMHPLIDHLSAMLPCWFLFDASWAFTKQSADLIRRCSKIVPVGRVKWIAGSPHMGKDDCCWYEFIPGHTMGPRLVPITMKGKSNGKAEMPLVSTASTTRKRQDSADKGSPSNSEIAGRYSNGAGMHSVQPNQGTDDGAGVVTVHGSSSAMVARLRSKLRFVVQERISKGNVEGK